MSGKRKSAVAAGAPEDKLAAIAPTAPERALFVCVRDRHGKGASCAGSGSRALLKNMQGMLAAEGISPQELTLRPCGCLGLCKQGPVLAAVGDKAAANRKAPKPKKKRKGVYVRVEASEAREVLRDALALPLRPA